MGTPSPPGARHESPSRLVLVGANHRTCSVDERGALTRRVTYRRICADPSAARALEDLVVLRTCNRVESYALTRRPMETGGAVRRAFSLRGGGGILYELEDFEAAAHLFRVAAGLDSIAIGESQISEQVRLASTGRPRPWQGATPLADLFARAARLAPRLRRLAGVDGRSASASDAAVRYIHEVVHASDIRVTLLGSGKMARLAAEALRGDARFFVVGRDFHKARAAATRLGGKAARLARLPHVLAGTDVLLAATSSKKPLVGPRTVARAQVARSGRPLWIVDLGVPRNVDPAVSQLDGVRLLTIDDLGPWAGPAPNPSGIARAERLIRQEAEKFLIGIRPCVTNPVLALRVAAERIRRQEVERALARMPGATAIDRGVVDKMADRLMNRLLHAPTVLVRRLQAEGHATAIEDLLARTASGGRR